LRYNVLISQTQRGRVFLPLRPIYAGLFGDAATFGTTWWILLTLAAALRARRRCRRGLCARCAYDLNGSLSIDHCPECGTPIPGRAAGAHSATSRPVSL
jgi:hypothetical protein